MDEKKHISWEDYDLYCFIKIVVKYFWMVILSALICVMGMYLVQRIALTPKYTSSVTFSVTSRSGSSQIGSVAASSTVASQFGELLASDLVQQAAAERMNLPSFPASVTIKAPASTNILNMDVTASSPELAYKSALAIMECHSEYSKPVFASAVLDNINGPTIAANATGNAARSLLLNLSAPIGALIMILLLAAFVLQSDTIQTPPGAKHQVDGKLLATVYHEKKKRTLRSRLSRKKTSLLITDPLCSFYYTETIHQLRVMIERAHEKDKRQIFVVTSCSENEGKSTIASNIALSLAQKHHRVLLVDGDLRRPAQSLIFEQPVKHGEEFGTFMANGFTEDALLEAIYHSESSHLHILFADSVRRRKTEAFSAGSFRPIFDTLRKHFSYIIVDTPPLGLFADADVIAEAADATVLVVRQDLVPAIAVNDAIDSLNESHSEFLGFILNNVHSFRAAVLPSGSHGYGYGYGYGYGSGYGYGYRRNYGYGYGRSKGKQPTVSKATAKKEEPNNE
ncbi:MAG: hypothetical protein CW335_00770 [Clostridiales bacterium]|nr:hypothetical protein [Clostridiales bacterium]